MTLVPLIPDQNKNSGGSTMLLWGRVLPLSKKPEDFAALLCSLSTLTRVCLRETCGGVGMTHREFDDNIMKVYLV